MDGQSPTRPRARLVHTGTGRVRVRLERGHRSEEVSERLRAQLQAHPSVDSVQTNARTGSVLITGGQAQALRAALDEALEVLEAAGPEGEGEAATEAVVAVVKRVDSRLGAASGGRLSLRWLVPATFVGVGLRQLIREGIGVGAVPWYVLIYYGVDSFLKLYPQHAPQPKPRPGVVRSDE